MDTHIAFALRLGPDPEERRMEDPEVISAALRADPPAWLHLSANHPDTPAWVDAHLGHLDPSIRAALVEPETRPRALRIGDGLLLFLRGINFNQGSDPEDMISLRLWLDPRCIVSLSRRPLRSVDALAERIGEGTGPERTGAFLADLIDELTDRIEVQVNDLDDRTEQLEADVIAGPHADLGAEVADQRLELTELRRYLPPQRDAVRDILRAPMPWLTDADRRKLGEQADQLTRVTESLEALREQLQTLRDELERDRADRLNRNLYVLSVISAVFLPLSFLTGLMGINLAGMPGASWSPAFWTFTGLLVLLGIGALGILRWMRIL
ncbi:zinc transporter [Palleronia aestuarii]|uniref:Zinc transporter n=1 Tax=Palleronia aestuarii TaxID=568105 RepID=A0A2W7MZA4_9RHOB|nr:zinc transporter ZntB [Palleronia aestuarii]PZX12923.1 zinc transporter [Palleronia aestuarii]